MNKEYQIYSDYLKRCGVIQEDALEHHGILGQKWGVRRFQNKDGSLTSEGKERYYGAFNPSGKKKNAGPNEKEKLNS